MRVTSPLEKCFLVLNSVSFSLLLVELPWKLKVFWNPLNFFNLPLLSCASDDRLFIFIAFVIILTMCQNLPSHSKCHRIVTSLDFSAVWLEILAFFPIVLAQPLVQGQICFWRIMNDEVALVASINYNNLCLSSSALWRVSLIETQSACCEKHRDQQVQSCNHNVVAPCCHENIARLIFRYRDWIQKALLLDLVVSYSGGKFECNTSQSNRSVT